MPSYLIPYLKDQKLIAKLKEPLDLEPLQHFEICSKVCRTNNIKPSNIIKIYCSTTTAQDSDCAEYFVQNYGDIYEIIKNIIV